MPKNYMKTKIIVNFILVNIVINAIFYYVGFHNFEGNLTLSATQNDLLFGLVMLGIFCSYIGFVNTRKDLLRGHHEFGEVKFNKLHKILPESNLVRSLILTGFVVLIVFPLFSLVPRMFGINDINHVVGFINKTLSAAVAAAVIGYVVISLSIEDYRSMLA